MLEVDDLDGTVELLRNSGARFRNDIVTGFGGKQILLEDPSRNPIALFEPARPEARLGAPPLRAHAPSQRRLLLRKSTDLEACYAQGWQGLQ